MEFEPHRILQVVTYMGRGGIESMLMNYFRRIDRTEVQFDFLVHRDFRADFDDEIESLGGRIYRLPVLNPFSGSYRKALRNFFTAHSYQVVHCHLNYMSGVILAEAKRAGVPVCISHAHNTAAKKDLKYLIKKSYALSIPKYANQLLACGVDAGKAIFGEHPFKVLPNAIDAMKFRYTTDSREKKRAELNLGDSFTVIHIGRFHYQKNQEFLIEAFAQVHKKDPNAKLLLVGDGDLRGMIEELAKSRNLWDSVRFLGVRGDTAELLHAADVYAFPSRFEGLPVTMIEAQAAGLPCVMSDTITDECIVTDLVTKLPTTEPKEWADEILKKRGTPRTDRLMDIQTSGYDIGIAAEKLQRFYLNGEPL